MSDQYDPNSLDDFYAHLDREREKEKLRNYWIKQEPLGGGGGLRPWNPTSSSQASRFPHRMVNEVPDPGTQRRGSIAGWVVFTVIFLLLLGLYFFVPVH